MINKLREFISNIVVIKSIDQNIIKEPKIVEEVENLSMRGENLSSILYRLFLRNNLKLPDIIIDHLQMGFPGYSLTFKVFETGKVGIEVTDEYGRKLLPPNIPDGFYKYLTLLTTLVLNPSLLVIDEIENSLHAGLLEIIYDLLKNSDFKSIITTHSPVLIDIAGLEEIIVSRMINGETIFQKANSIEELAKILRELEVMPSSYLLKYTR